MSDTPLTPDSTPPAAPIPAAKPRTPDWWLMTKKFIRKGTSVASFSPSQGSLCRQMCANIDYDTVQCIVELGAGTGPVTAEIIKRLKPHTRFLIVEIDPDFCTRLRDRFPGADVIEGDASKMEELLAARGLTQVDHVISGLPLPSFPKVLRDGIIRSSAKVLTPTGTFRQLTNMPWVYMGLYKKYFREVKFNFVPLNIPPSGVYTCKEYITESA
jgi:phospholipid N-methyltransferase